MMLPTISSHGVFLLGAALTVAVLALAWLARRRDRRDGALDPATMTAAQLRTAGLEVLARRGLRAKRARVREDGTLCVVAVRRGSSNDDPHLVHLIPGQGQATAHDVRRLVREASSMRATGAIVVTAGTVERVDVTDAEIPVDILDGAALAAVVGAPPVLVPALAR